MSNLVKQSSPPFLFTYWNPLAKDSNLVGSWFDYVRDVSLAKYAADSVGQYLQQTSADQISAIDSTGRRICGALYSGFSGLQAELEKVTKELQGVNQRLDLVLDEARTSNLLQENMAELLRIPDSQKQRQHHIEMALKFLKNALKDQDLYQDALRELLEAEKLMHADYFVLHRIGMIYLYVPSLGNPEKALDYFSRAGKYALVESHPDAARLSNILNKKVNKRFTEQAEFEQLVLHAATETFRVAETAGQARSSGLAAHLSKAAKPAGSKQRDGILPDERIGRGERQPVRLCLADQHPVERIAMQRGQSAQLRNGGFIQSQRHDKVFFALLRDELRGRLRQGQFAEAVFDGDLPERNGAQEDLIIRVAYGRYSQ